MMSLESLLGCIATEAIEGPYRHPWEPEPWPYTQRGRLREKIRGYGYSRRQAGKMVHTLTPLVADALRHAREVPSAKPERWLADKAILAGSRHDDALSIALEFLS